MEAYEALISRASPLTLGEPAPDAETERKLIAAALRAPDHGRLRPWLFISIRGEDRLRLGEILASSFRLREPSAGADVVERERQKALRAPLILVVAARISDNPKIPAIEQIISAGAAAQNVMLASHALGFGAMWKTGAAAYDPIVKEALGLRPNDQIAGFIYIGTTVAAPKSLPPLDPAGFLSELPR
ncbi:MAG: nitroreductase [Rhodomicrobium sp.]